jgi:hypothetical protein
MKYLKIVIQPFKIKGDEEDWDQLQADVLEKIMAMAEAETLQWSVEENEDEDDDY